MASVIDIEGIGEVYAKKLHEAGVATTEGLLAEGATPGGRKALAEKTGIGDRLILGKDGKAVATATFELYADSAKEFRFRLRDGDGALLATSGKGYKTKAECQKVIEAIRRDAARAKLDDQTK